MIQAIETTYAGCRFRSRLEAKWAVFFDTLGAKWEYEPQGYVIDGIPYLPDFLLTECGTWVEVKGHDPDIFRLERVALGLPVMPKDPRAERGPKFMLLGPIPRPWYAHGDWVWWGADERSGGECSDVNAHWLPWSFGMYRKNRRPWGMGCCVTPDWDAKPAWDPCEEGCPEAYAAARSARFEHGQSGAFRGH